MLENHAAVIEGNTSFVSSVCMWLSFVLKQIIKRLLGSIPVHLLERVCTIKVTVVHASLADLTLLPAHQPVLSIINKLIRHIIYIHYMVSSLCPLYTADVHHMMVYCMWLYCIYTIILLYIHHYIIVVQVRKGLIPLIQEIKQKGTKPDSSVLAGSFDTKAQAALCNAIAVDLGFDLEQGRLDVSVHPFTGGNAMVYKWT